VGVKPFASTEHPGQDSAPSVELNAQGEAVAAGNDKPGMTNIPGPKYCLVCRGRLQPGERKVHIGTCRRQWRTALQKKRRRMRRTWES